MVNVVVTGITGFIGSHLAKRLIEKGYSVYGIERPVASRMLLPIKEIANDIVLLSADITDHMSILHALRTADPDYICHLAALSPVRLSFERPFEYEKVNYLGTMNVAHALTDLPDYKKRKMIAASTAEVYGIHTHGRPLKEEDQLNPSSPYSVSKAAADMYLRMAARAYELNAVILRPVNTFGRKFETNFMVEYLITTMLKKERVYIGAPDSIREYIYVDDHTGGYLAAMEKGVQGEVYNISTGEGMKNREITERIAKMVGYDGSKIVLGAYPPGYPVRPAISDQPYIILDPNKARNELGWRQKTSLDEGLKKTISYWRSFMEARPTT
ncbi:MAG: GDP-mannose 4,6-dehydratase [Candidatus Atabeyarchaeum deiterrae]